MKSLVCLALTEKTLTAGLDQIERYRGLIDLVELRADFLDPLESDALKGFPAKAGVPVILTIRRQTDRGGFNGSETERLKLLALGSHGYRYVDLEADLQAPALAKTLRQSGCRIIRSLHDFEGVPVDLSRRLQNLARSSDELPKAAVMPRNSQDLVALLRCFRETAGQERILIGMGEVGLPTRILAGKLGSYLTFCSAPQKQSAPGQIDPETLHEMYRFSAINPDTRVLGVIGNPISHSKSPQIHNAGLAALGLNQVYLPFLVDDPAAFLEAADLMDVDGVSVTMPHKETIIPLLDDRDDSLAGIGACNTVVRRSTGWWGTNTDVDGFLKPLSQRLDLTSGLKAVVIGAGGAARSVVFALGRFGIKPLILNRTASRAQKLATEFDCRSAGLDQIEGLAQNTDLLVQTTSVGMEPDIDRDPLAGYGFSGREVVFDLIYRPHETQFLRRALSAGCSVIPGLEMLQNQAEAQFKYFTGRDFPAAKQ